MNFKDSLRGFLDNLKVGDKVRMAYKVGKPEEVISFSRVLEIEEGIASVGGWRFDLETGDSDTLEPAQLLPDCDHMENWYRLIVKIEKLKHLDTFSARYGQLKAVIKVFEDFQEAVMGGTEYILWRSLSLR